MKLHNIDPEDIEDTILEIEKSLKIEFAAGELVNVETFGDLCDEIFQKLDHSNDDHCTTQQAYYRLREVFVEELGVSRKELGINTPLEDILNRENRRQRIKMIAEKTELEISELRPPNWISYLLATLMIVGLIYVAVNWKIGIMMFALSIFGIQIADRLGNELESRTFGEFVKRITALNYVSVRRTPNSVNLNEIEGLIRSLFQIRHDLDVSALKRSARFDFNR